MTSAVAVEEQVKLELRELRKSFGDVQAVAGVDLRLGAGQMLALLGPSGCGKTTTLRMIAGLEQVTSGTILIDGEPVAGTRLNVPPERRGLGMVFQSYALWPHMTVFDNVAYGLRRLGMPRAEIATRVRDVLSVVNMAGTADRPATDLSGGQQQRVAVARALATRPRVLLFDEPLSNLDAVLRESMRFEIRTLQQAESITAVYVTHSQEEALAIADVIGVMDEGRLQQLGSPAEVYLRPRNRFVAGFVGLASILSGTVVGRDGGRVVVDVHGARLGLLPPEGWERAAGALVSVAVRPEHLRIEDSTAPSVSPGLRLSGRVRSTVYSGSVVDTFVEVEGAEQAIRVQQPYPAQAEPGDQVVLSASADRCVLLED